MEFTKEEKKAIEWLKKSEFFSARLYGPIILNLIKKQQNEIKHQRQQRKYWRGNFYKQQEEIEDLKTITRTYNSFNGAIDEKIIIADDKYFTKIGYFKNSYISKDKIKSIIDNFRKIKSEILSSENMLGRASITYDILRNDYCEKMLNQLLEEK